MLFVLFCFVFDFVFLLCGGSQALALMHTVLSLVPLSPSQWYRLHISVLNSQRINAVYLERTPFSSFETEVCYVTEGGSELRAAFALASFVS